MYLEHFGLSAQPFRLTPDIGFLFMSEAHRRAKAYMDYTVWNRESFVVVTGEIGCGKTTLVQKLISELDEKTVVVAKIFQTQLDEVEFLQAVLVEFGLNPFNARKVELLDMLNTFVIEQFLQNKQVVLIVDDAHNLSLKVLEEIRMLAGLETKKEKMLHMILVGQPQLNDTLDRPEMEQLMQRVKLRYHIRALTEKELGDYISHRLTVAGANDGALFPADTLPVIFKYAGGIPRLANILCDTVLTGVYADDSHTITAEVIEAAASDLRWPPYAERVARQASREAAPNEGVQEMLSEQAHTLTSIAREVGGLAELPGTLASLRQTLAAIEVHLRDLAGRQLPAPGASAERGAKSR
jgi:general secretion pathway protein A